MTRFVWLLMILLLTLAVPSCANPKIEPMIPIATGAKSRTVQGANFDPSKPITVAIWGDNAVAVNAIATIIIRSGERVVERAKIQQILDEQSLRLIRTSDTEADILKAGQLAGADMIIFVEATLTPAPSTRGIYLPNYGGSLSSQTFFHASVTTKGILVQTGEMLWSGSATYPKPINNPEQGTTYLARAALLRATCDYSWTDEKECHKP